MGKDIFDPAPVIVDPGKEGGPGTANHGVQGWPLKWTGSDFDTDGTPLSPEILDIIARLDDGDAVGLLLPAVQKIPAEATLPLTFYKITDQDSLDALARIAPEFEGFDNVTFLDPPGTEPLPGIDPGPYKPVIIVLKPGVDVGQDVGAWSPLSDFGDSDILL